MARRVLLSLLLTPLLAAPAAADAATTGEKLSRRPIAENPAWRDYVLDPKADTQGPTAVEVQGDAGAVSNPEGLKQEGGGATTIRASGQGAPRLVLDLGVNVGGRVEVGVSSGSGARVRLAYSEARRFLTEDGDISPGRTLAVNDDPDGRTDVLEPGAQRFGSPGIRGAQRWVLLQLDGPGEVTIDYVRVRVTHLRPAPEDYVGRFLASDPLVTKTWWGAAYTWNIATFRDEKRGGNVIVTDAAKRDRLAWLGDLGVENLVGQYGLRQAPGIVRDTLELFACQQDPDGYLPMASDIHVTCPGDPGPADGRPPSTSETNPAIQRGNLPEYTAWWVIGLAEYARYSGDDAFARRMLPVARRAAGYFRTNLVDGLFTTRDEGAINWHPFDLAYGQDAHTQAVWFRALRGLAELEDGTGIPGVGDGLRREAAALQARTIAALWDERAGALRMNTANPRVNHPHDAQAEGVLSGLLEGERARRALAFVTGPLQTPFGPKTGELTDDPFMSQYVSPFIGSDDLLARFALRDAGGALDLVRRTYGHMVTTDPASTMWEKFSVTGDPASYAPNQAGAGRVPDELLFAGRGTTSLAHPWSSGPVPALSAHVAGLQPIEAGWKRWRVDPQPGDLRWAQGQVGTPQGPLAARWARGADDRSFRMTVVAPNRADGEVHVPLGADREVFRNGRRVRGERRGDALVVRQGGGRATYAWSLARKRCTTLPGRKASPRRPTRRCTTR